MKLKHYSSDSPDIKMNLSPSKILMKLLHSLSCIEILWCRQGGDSILINFKYNGREFNLISPESNPIKYLRYLWMKRTERSENEKEKEEEWKSNTIERVSIAQWTRKKLSSALLAIIKSWEYDLPLISQHNSSSYLRYAGSLMCPTTSFKNFCIEYSSKSCMLLRSLPLDLSENGAILRLQIFWYCK